MFGIANLVIGTVAACMLELSSTSSRCGATKSEVASLLKVMEVAAKQIGMDPNILLGPTECKELLDAVPMVQALSVIGSHANRIPPDELFAVLAGNARDSMSLRELAEALLRLRGPWDTIHASLVQSDVHTHEAEFGALLKQMERKLAGQHTEAISDLESKIRRKARDLHDASAAAIHRLDPCTNCLRFIEQAEAKTESTACTLSQVISDLKASRDRVGALEAKYAMLNRSDAATQTYRLFGHSKKWPPMKAKPEIQGESRRSQSQPSQRVRELKAYKDRSPGIARRRGEDKHSSSGRLLTEEFRHYSKFASVEQWALEGARRMLDG